VPGKRVKRLRLRQPGRLILVGLVLAALLSASSLAVRAEGGKGVVSGSFTIVAGPPVPPPGTWLYLPKMHVAPSFHAPAVVGTTARPSIGAKLDPLGFAGWSVGQAVAGPAGTLLRR